MVAFGAIGSYTLLSSHADSVNCTYHATTSTFSSTFSSATGGSTICLAPGNYGDWAGGSKTSMVTITPDVAAGATAPTPPTPKAGGTTSAGNVDQNGTGTDGNVIFNGLNFTNASFITMNGITFSDDVDMPWGTTTGNVHDVTITNSIFHAHLEINDANMNNANIIINYNMFPGDKADCIKGSEGRIQVATGGSHKYASDGVIVENNNIGGVPSVQCDGIQTGSSGMQVLNNWFHDFHYDNSAHTDGLQNYGSINEVVKGNFFYDVPDGYVAYDGTSNADIENNVSVNDCSNSCDGASPNQFGVYANTGNTLVNHNTVVGGKNSYGGTEGDIMLGTKGTKCSGINVTNNVATSIDNGSTDIAPCTYTASYNLLQKGGGNGTGNVSGAPQYVGGDCGNLSADPPGACGDVWANFMLKTPTPASPSPGYGAADNGTNMGAYGPGPSTPGGPYIAGGGGSLPAAPTVTLTASPTSVSSGSASTLTWSSTNASSCAASWTSATGTSGSASVSPTVTTTYNITCSGTGGSSNASTTVTVAASQPAAPTVTLTAAPTSIASGASSKLTWSSTNATACTASWAAAAATTAGSVTLSPTATTVYTITCTGAGGSATATATVAIKVPDSKPPTTAITAPANNSTVSGTVNITANATDDVGVTKVEIYIDNSLLASLTTAGPTYSTTWNAQAATKGTHTISSKAYDAAGNVGTSSTTTVTVNNPDTTAPTVPANLTGTAISPTQVNLSWSASTDSGGVDHYIVERNNVAIASVKSPALTYSDTTVSGSTSYTYNVVAVDQSGNASAQSTTATVKTPAPQDTTAPTVPANLAGTAVSPTQVNLSWSASTDSGSGLAGYQVFRDGVKLVQVSAQTTSYGDATVNGGTAYSYYVVAIDGANNVSKPSNTVALTTPQASSGSTLLVGSQVGGNSKDTNGNGTAEAFRLSSVSTGTLTNLTFFNDAASGASTVYLGIYSDNNGQPGHLLSQGSVSTPAKNAWVKVPITSVAVQKGTAYWVAVLGQGHGKIIFHDNDNGSVDYTSKSGKLKSLPATWQSGTKYNDSPLSVYGTN